MDKPLEHVVIIGCGLLGASLGLALRGKGLARVVTGVGRGGSPSVSIALQRGAITRATSDAAVGVSGARLPADAGAIPPAQLVVVCTPVRQFPDAFRAIAPVLATGAVVTDVGSTKGDVMRWAAELLPPHAAFIGSHPMAGSEKSGPDAARADLYENGVCLVCRPAKAPENAHRLVTDLWRAIGMRIIECRAEQQDQWVAAVSHLPHAIASTLMKTVSGDSAALETAAGGLKDMTRIAAGDVTMWTDIFMTNRQAVSEAIGRFAGELAVLKSAIDRGDEQAIRATLETAKLARDAFTARRRPQGGAAQRRGE